MKIFGIQGKHLLIAGFVLFWYFFRESSGSFEILNLDFIGIFVVIAYFWLPDFLKSLQADTSQLITEGHHGSNSTNVVCVGNWAVMRLGDIQSSFIFMKGDDATVVVPRFCVYNVGKNLLVNARTFEVDFSELPQPLRSQIETGDGLGTPFTKDRILFGFMPANMEASLENTYWDAIFSSLDGNRIVAEKDRAMRLNLGNFEYLAGLISVINDKMNDEGFIRRFFGPKHPGPEAPEK